MRRNLLFLVSLCFLLGGCPDPGPEKTTDAGPDAGAGDADSDSTDTDVPATSIELGRFDADGDFEALPAEGGTMEIISGFQGGWHVEPGIRVPKEIPKSALTGEVVLNVRDAETGDVLNQSAHYGFDENSFSDTPGGWVFHSPPVIFEIDSPEEVEGLTVDLEAEIEFNTSGVEGGLFSVTVELVDETDEFVPG